MASKWEHLQRKYKDDPAIEFRLREAREELERRYNRPLWRLARWWDRKRGR